MNPTEKMIVGSIEEALNRERLKSLQDTSVVTLIIHLPGDKGVSEEEREYRTATLYKFLVDFRKEKNLSYSIDHSFDRFVARATFSNDYCKGISYQKIMAVLRKNLPFPFPSASASIPASRPASTTPSGRCWKAPAMA